MSPGSERFPPNEVSADPALAKFRPRTCRTASADEPGACQRQTLCGIAESGSVGNRRWPGARNGNASGRVFRALSGHGRERKALGGRTRKERRTGNTHRIGLLKAKPK